MFFKKVKKQGGGGYLDSSNQKSLALKQNAIKFNMLIFSLLLTIVFCCCFCVTYSALQSTKTATGVISIVLPPTTGLTSSNLYIDTNSPAVYLGSDDSGTSITSSTKLLPKLVLVDTGSGSSGYVKIEISVLGESGVLSYNESGTSATFSDSVAMVCTQTSDLITLTSNSSVSKFSYIFLDNIICNLQTSGALSDATLQVKIYASLDSTFDNKSTTSLLLNLNSSEFVEYNVTITFINDISNKDFLITSAVVKSGSVLSVVDTGIILTGTLVLNLVSTKSGVATTIYDGCHYVSTTAYGAFSYKLANGDSVDRYVVTENIEIYVRWHSEPT